MRPLTRLARGALAPLALAGTTALAAPPADPLQSADTSRDAYQQIAWALVTEAQRAEILNGRGLVRQSWVISPSLDPDIAGLGPTYNRPSCLSCHPRNGRGEPPATPDAPMHSMLVRLSVPGAGPHGEPQPEPVYGEQLNEFGIPGVPGEGEAFLEWDSHELALADGTRVSLQRPTVHFRRLQHGSLAAQMMHSARVAPPIFGLGLLEAVPEATVLALAQAQRAGTDGVAGRPNRVWDIARQAMVLGRFGLKANQPTVRQQIAGALAGDMGITSSLYPEPNCPPAQVACAAVHEAHPELSDAALDAMTRYHYVLAVPAPRHPDAPQVQRGRALFEATGCASCHTPSLRTGPFPAEPALAHRTIAPYTDLLVHDMGPGLADGRPDHLADGQSWRTPPLWGLGLLETVNGHSRLLHDGRARTVLEAILWHGGEAAKAQARVRQLDATDRDALLAFLASL